jgi:hypothetical protein
LFIVAGTTTDNATSCRVDILSKLSTARFSRSTSTGLKSIG